jgi:hypothetical protein
VWPAACGGPANPIKLTIASQLIIGIVRNVGLPVLVACFEFCLRLFCFACQFFTVCACARFAFWQFHISFTQWEHFMHALQVAILLS